jgi:hypothetical protein
MYWDGHGWAAPQAATATATKKSSNGGKVASGQAKAPADALADSWKPKDE